MQNSGPRELPSKGTAEQSGDGREACRSLVSHKKEVGFLLSVLGPAYPNPSPPKGSFPTLNPSLHISVTTGESLSKNEVNRRKELRAERHMIWSP